MRRVFIFAVMVAMLMASTGMAVTVAFICDARPKNNGEPALTYDLNQMDDQMDAGWILDAIQHIGDMDYIAYQDGENTLDALAVSDVAGVPLFHCIGNHELNNMYDLYDVREAFTNYPSGFNPVSGPAGTEYTTYYYEVGDMLIVVLNEYWDGNNDGDGDWSTPSGGPDDDDSTFKYNTGDGGYITDELFDWLKGVLRTSNKTYKLVVGHEPAYPVDRHINDSLDKDTSNRDKFWNLLRTERVIAYMTGHDHNYHLDEHDGVFEADAGVCGGHEGGGGPGQNDNFATIIYTHIDESGNFEFKAVHEEPGTGNWDNPVVIRKSLADIENQTLVNTWESAGTVSRYFVDYTAADEDNPDWSSYNNSQWWLPEFDDIATGWSDGELCVGVATNPGNWGWINTEVANQNGVHGVFQRINFIVHNKDLYYDMVLGVDYDDAIIVWLNGVEIYSSTNAPTVGADDIWDKTASEAHNSDGQASANPVYTDIDVSAFAGYLNEGGSNVLAIGNWNYNPTEASELVAGVELVLEKGSPPPPEPASVPSPADGATQVDLDADLNWTAGAGAESHDVYFGIDSTPDESEFKGNQTETTYILDTLANNTTYYWRIDEVGPGGTTTGTVWSFTTIITPPGPATNPSPADVATDVSVTADLSWTAGSGADSRDVYFGTDSADLPMVSEGQSGTTFDPGTMANSMTYYWRIDEKNTAGTTTGTVWSFTTAPVPGQASSPSPADGAVDVSIEADLSWTAGSDATSHDVFFGSSDPPPFVQNQAETTYEPGALSPDTTYYWQVDEVGPGGVTTGLVWSFTTESVPPATADSDIPVKGTVGGNYLDTQSSDDIYETITETKSGGRPSTRYSMLEHKWTINVLGGDTVTFYVEAYKNDSDDGDDFVFAYSMDDSSYTDMLTVNKISDDDTTQSYIMPASTAGTVYIRVTDTDQTAGNMSFDTISVDYMYIKCAGPGEPDTEPPTPDPMTWATEPNATGSTSISMTATTASDDSGVQYYFTCTAGGGHDSGWQDSPTYEDTGLAPETTYTYTVKAHDKSPAQNETQPSTEESATTLELTLPGQATDPNPSEGQVDVNKNTVVLSWLAGINATSHDVYLGTNPDALILLSEGQSETIYEPGRLERQTTYYWRIDEVNAAGTTTGIVWSFTTK